MMKYICYKAHLIFYVLKLKWVPSHSIQKTSYMPEISYMSRCPWAI